MLAKEASAPGAFSKMNENYAKNLTKIQKKQVTGAAASGQSRGAAGHSGARKSPIHSHTVQQKLLAVHLQHAHAQQQSSQHT